MIFEAMEVTLKTCERAVLKTPEITDAPEMLAYITQACRETPFLLGTPEEFESMSLTQEEAFINDTRSSENKLMIACFVDGELAGEGELIRMTNKKTLHRAKLGLALLKKFWGRGIATRILTELFICAKDMGIEIIELDYIKGNERAARLYEFLGFRTIATHPNAFKQKDGTYLSNIFMQKYL